MPVKIVSQKDLKNLSLRGDEREETGYYKNYYYPNGVLRPEELRGTAPKLPYAEKRETALDIAVRELQLQSSNIISENGYYIPPRQERYKRGDSRNDRRYTSGSKDVKKVANGAEIYGSEHPPLKNSQATSVKTGSLNNGDNGANPRRWATIEKPKPARLEPDVPDFKSVSQSIAKDPVTRDSAPQNGAKESASESSEATSTSTEATTDVTPEGKTVTTTKTTETENPEPKSPTPQIKKAIKTPVITSPDSAKDETSSTSSQKPESESTPAVNGKTAKPPVIPPPFYKSMIHRLKAKDGEIAPLIDIGANLTKLCYKNRMGSILRRAKAAGVTTILITGTSYNSSRAGIRLCQDWNGYEGVKLRATVGLHPLDAAGVVSGKYANRWCGSLERLLKEDTGYVVAVGECGLDYKAPTFDLEHDPQSQKHVFAKQLMLADKYNLPVFAHCRAAHEDFVKIAKPWMTKANHPVRLVVHCHTDPDPKHLNELLEAGAWIGLTGIITDKREGRFNEAIINQIPWDRLMIETDAPFLLPSNACAIRDIDRRWENEPCLLPFVAKRIAEVSGDITDAEVAAITTNNAVKFFGLEDHKFQA